MSNPEMRRLALELAVKASAEIGPRGVVERAEKYLGFLEPAPPQLTREAFETIRDAGLRWSEPTPTKEQWVGHLSPKPGGPFDGRDLSSVGAGWGPKTGVDNLADLRAGEPLADITKDPHVEKLITAKEVDEKRRAQMVQDLFKLAEGGGLAMLRPDDARLILKMLGEAAD